MVIKAVIFDIGGVVVRSPMLALAAFEQENALPPNYLNCIIAAQGANGAFQKFERGEIALYPFYAEFSRELSDTENANRWYKAYCDRRGTKCPRLPNVLHVDGREIFGRMMRESGVFDGLVVQAIQRIRASRKYLTIALTNNYSRSEEMMVEGAPPGFSPQKELEFLGWQDGATPAKLRALFDDFCDSSSLGLRKPDPAFYLLACKRNDILPEEAVFLDDIGYNLKAAQELGIHTIQVSIGGVRRALEQLEQKLELDLTSKGVDSKIPDSITPETAKL